MNFLADVDSSMKECIENCTRCHALCLNMAAVHCLHTGGKHVEPEHFRLMMDCAQICAVSADFMLRGSPLHLHTCRACAEICRLCAKSCEEAGGMDPCVEACRRCEESCRRMSGSH